MRLIVFLFLLIIGSSCGTTKKLAKNSTVLNGTWIPIKQEMSGKELPILAFEKQKLTINDSLYSMIAESIDKGVITYTDNKMDIYGRQGVNAGKHFTAIYKVENEQLTICYNLAGDSYPVTFETKSKRLLFLSVFNKEGVK
ncbi:MAG: hypothetical protein ACKVOW_16040 [Chitinophagaceae bacterium]